MIGGWLPGKGSRAGRLGALLWATTSPARIVNRSLRYAGRVGTGFDERELERLGASSTARARDSSPFAGTQPPREARFVEPELVAEIEFRQWTRERMLRHSVIQGAARGQAGSGGADGAAPATTDARAAPDGNRTGAEPRGDVRTAGLPGAYEVLRETSGVEIEVRGTHAEAVQPRQGPLPAQPGSRRAT